MTVEHEDDMNADWSAKELSVLRSAELDVPPRGSVEKTLAAIGAGAVLGIGAGAGTASSVGSAVRVAGLARWSAVMKWLSAAAIGAGVASTALVLHRHPKAAAAVSSPSPSVAAPPAAALAATPATATAVTEATSVPSVEQAPKAVASAPARSDGASSARETKETLAAEIRLIDEARARLRAGDAPGSLAALADYDRLVGRGGSMRTEATVVRIEALQASGDSARASALAERFLSKNPSSAYADYVKRILARAH